MTERNDPLRPSAGGGQDDATRASLVIEAPVTAHRVRELRHRLRDWARTVGFDDDTVGAVELAAHEAMTNALDHAYPPHAPAWVRLIAVTGGAMAEVQISDRGRWRPPPADPGPRGHGLGLIEGLAARTEIETAPNGTTVTLSWPLPHRAHDLDPDLDEPV